MDVRNQWDNTALLLACNKGHMEIVTYLIEHGANVNMRNIHGWNPLITASSIGAIEIVKYLIEKGANLDGEDACVCM